MAEQNTIRSLEINLISAKDLQDVNLVTKMDVYAVISISSDLNNHHQKVKTGVDRGCGTNPTWNFEAKFGVDESLARNGRITLKVKLVCDRSLGDKAIGEVNVSVKELLDFRATGDDQQGKRFVSYQVIKPSGNPRGELRFSYRFSEKPLVWGPPPPNVTTGAEYPQTATSAPPVLAEYLVPYSGPDPHPKFRYPTPPYIYGYPHPGPPPPPHGYGGVPGYGYQYQYHMQPSPIQYQAAGPNRNKKNNFGLGLGAGLVGGVLGGLLIGDVVSDVASYDPGFADDGGFGF